ncbi:WSC domain-containing protein [Hirsutella rhossiliensis]|uniref:WSC domain-containing protein n=1 Tax=Hirsutella rhossiliensis TaxID=111463 RepID=A0A9P8N5R0_9HYPO|nr:WSC domain-containing protein [Hirsutella rhossiliensis]KAH0967269.1 WSC domain-containing protein [Hirsutella rhossiliensis]
MAPLPRLLLSLTLLVLAAAAQTQHVRIYNESTKYTYHGCFNETTDIDGSDRSRALADGINQVKRGEMTVPLCLGFCANGRTQYRYAGLEWSRECWCSQTLSGISTKLDDARCDFPCEGDQDTSCGGSLKLTVYRLRSASTGLRVSAFVASLGFAVALIS